MTAVIDETKAEAFGERLLGVLSDGTLALMISIGHRTRLFDTLAGLPGATSEELARAAGLDERYVREWLGAMYTGKLLECDPATRRFSLPPEHAACLTRAATPHNLAVLAQFVAVLGSVEDQVVECFQRGGGVPYSAFGRFHEVMAEDSAQTVVAGLDAFILPLAPGLIERLEAGVDVLDVGCGMGRALNHLARRFPASRFRGYDLSSEAIAAAQAEAPANATFEARDVTELGEAASYDLITAFDAIHDQIAPDRVLSGIARALRPGGLFLMQDIRASSDVLRNRDNPLAALLYTISTMHCMTVSLAAGGAGLGTCWGEELALEMLSAAGFSEVRVEQLEHDIQNNFYLARR